MRDDARADIELAPLATTHHEAVTELLATRVQRLQNTIGLVPGEFTDHAGAAAVLAELFTTAHGAVAIERGQIVGYLGWHEFPTLRGMTRPAAWVPAYGLVIAAGAPPDTLERLYGAAARSWAVSARQVAAVGVLAGDDEIERFFVTNGFGMIVRDAVRAMTPLSSGHTQPWPDRLATRRATVDDAADLAQLDIEHCAHYGGTPTFMVPPPAMSAHDIVEFIGENPNSIWVAVDVNGPQGFLRCEAVSTGATRLLHSPTTISISGVFTRPALRGRNAASDLLEAAIGHYAALGYDRIVTDFETTNPSARTFWSRHMTTVASSFMRVFEHI